jgi:hypothetical protein
MKLSRSRSPFSLRAPWSKGRLKKKLLDQVCDCDEMLLLLDNQQFSLKDAVMYLQKQGDYRAKRETLVNVLYEMGCSEADIDIHGSKRAKANKRRTNQEQRGEA